VVIFLTLVACLVVWTTVAMPGPIAEVNVDVLVPAPASFNDAKTRSAKYAETP
jgi:hypothetical protein